LLDKDGSFKVGEEYNYKDTVGIRGKEYTTDGKEKKYHEKY
jgi:hypothetical protein